MKKLRRFFVIAVSSLILFFLIVATALMLFVNPNDFKPQIEQKVFALTHKHLILHGNIHWAFFPKLAISSNDIQFDTIKIKQFKAKTALLSLLKGNLVVDSIKLTQITLPLAKNQQLIIDSVTTPLDIQNDIITLKSITAKLYQGTYRGKVIIDNHSNKPKITTEGQLTQLQVQPFLQALVGVKHIQLSGTADVNINLTTAGDLNTLNGQGDLVLSKGVLNGLDIGYWIHNAQALTRKHSSTQDNNNTQQTPFNRLSASFKVQQGVVTNDDLLVKAADIQAKGRGTANLVSQQLRYGLLLQRVKNGELKDAPIPLSLKGPFSNLSIRLNTESLVKQQLQEQAKVQIGDRLQKSLGKDLGDKMGKQINNLFH